MTSPYSKNFWRREMAASAGRGFFEMPSESNFFEDGG
jgi:hypothetical protein